MLEMVRGDTAEFDIRVTYPRTNLPVNIDGATIRFMAKHSFEDLDAAAIINITTPTDITITNGANGEAHISVPAAQTTSLENKRTRLYTDCQVEKAGKKWTGRDVLIVHPEVVMA
jgi:hypothetical protein